MFADTDHWLAQCEWCLIAKGDYTKPKTQQDSLVAHQPLEPLCIDFTKADIAKGGKENILVLTDAFSKYSQAFMTNNQKSLTVAKILVEKWFSVFGIPARIHSDQGRSFDNEIISHLCKMHGIKQSTTTSYNLCGKSQCEQFNFSTVQPYLDWWGQIGQSICHLWCMLTMPLPMHQLAFNHMSSCLGARHQCPVTIGLDSTAINQMVSNLRLSGWTSNWMPCCMQTNSH